MNRMEKVNRLGLKTAGKFFKTSPKSYDFFTAKVIDYWNLVFGIKPFRATKMIWIKWFIKFFVTFVFFKELII